MWLGLLAVGVLVMAARDESDASSRHTPAGGSERARMIDLVRREAIQQGVPPDVALATAQIESGFNPRAEGDVRWHLADGGARYRDHVLSNARFARNPYRSDAQRWHSYGLFQLLAPYHTRDTEDPRALLDPEINAGRGVAVLKRLGARTHGDWTAARLLYTGASALEAAKQAAIADKFQRAREGWA